MFPVRSVTYVPGLYPRLRSPRQLTASGSPHSGSCDPLRASCVGAEAAHVCRVCTHHHKAERSCRWSEVFAWDECFSQRHARGTAIVALKSRQDTTARTRLDRHGDD